MYVLMMVIMSAAVMVTLVGTAAAIAAAIGVSVALGLGMRMVADTVTIFILEMVAFAAAIADPVAIGVLCLLAVRADVFAVVTNTVAIFIHELAVAYTIAILAAGLFLDTAAIMTTMMATMMMGCKCGGNACGQHQRHSKQGTNDFSHKRNLPEF